jgi:hypothetical protein
MPADMPIQFGKAAALRIKRAVQRIEAMPYPQIDKRPKYPVLGGGGGLFEAIVTNSISAFNANTNTYGTGTAQIYMPSLNTNTNSYQAVVDTSFGTNGSVTVLNWYKNSGTVSVNTHIYVTQRADQFELVTADCPS